MMPIELRVFCLSLTIACLTLIIDPTLLSAQATKQGESEIAQREKDNRRRRRPKTEEVEIQEDLEKAPDTEEAGTIELKSNNAQVQKVTWGLKGGINLANLTVDESDDDSPDLDSKMGLCLGVYVTRHINEVFAIQPEVLISQRGAKSEETVEEQGVTVDTETSINLMFLDIPILAKISAPINGSMTPNFFLGPYAGLKLSSKIKVKAEAEGQSVEAETDLDEWPRIDYGLVFGGGLDYDLGSGAFIFEARYSLGMRADEEDESKSRVFTLLAGYSFK
jgi:hypothetical protein